MVRVRHIIIFIALIAVYAVIAGLKGFNGISPRESSRLSGLSLSDLDTTPYHVSDTQVEKEEKQAEIRRARGLNNGMHLAGIQSDKNVTPALNAGADPLLAAQDKTADAKKKKKKKAKAKVEEKNIATNTFPFYVEKARTGVHESAPSQVTSFIASTNTSPAKDSSIPISFEDWAKLILGRPQPENVNKLVDYYKTNIVTAEIFYQVLTAMMEEPNPEQHDLAVGAATNAEGAGSFVFLVDVLKSEGQGSTTAQKASKGLEAYRTLANVGYLRDVLAVHMNDLTIARLVVQTLNRSTAEYLDNRKPSADTTTTTSSDTTKTATDEAKRTNSFRRAYAGFEPLLERVLVVYKSNSDITEPAQKALTRIKNLSIVVADLNS